MKWILLLLFFCCAASADSKSCHTENHTLKIFFTGSSGFKYYPEFESVGEADDVLAAYCNKNITKGTQDWMEKIFEEHHTGYLLFKKYCSVDLPAFFKDMIIKIKQHFNQTGGSHVFQRIAGCELDPDTKNTTGFLKYGYDGEDFLKFDLETQTWISLTPQADFLKQSWNADSKDKEFHVYMLSKLCPLWLNITLVSGSSPLLKKVYPTVSLLQRTPSSPVRCHATGFYPTNASMFWRKDGQKVHEDVELREIFPNDDYTFQLHVDLDVSSIPSEDWSRYDCVFQFSGAEDRVIIKLDQAEIKTNWGKLSQTTIIIVAVTAVIFLVCAVVGLIVYKKKNDPLRWTQPALRNVFCLPVEERERLNPQTVVMTTYVSERLNPETRLMDTSSCSDVTHLS